jgi:AraC-like DNA-binding protein
MSGAHRLDGYRDIRAGSGIHPAAPQWGYWLCHPPYRRMEPVASATALLRGAQPAQGTILIAAPPFIAPEHPVVGIDWLRRALPWTSIAVRMRAKIPPTTFSSLVTRLSRRGATPLHESVNSPGAVADAIRHAFVPEADVTHWMAVVLPKWPALHQIEARRLLLLGYHRADGPPPDIAARLPRREALWIRVGRALRAATVLQRRSEEPNLRLALEAGYSDDRAMDRALRRVFGVRIAQVRNTVGWEWLLWRFLSGMGQGKEKRWDQ